MLMISIMPIVPSVWVIPMIMMAVAALLMRPGSDHERTYSKGSKHQQGHSRCRGVGLQ